MSEKNTSGLFTIGIGLIILSGGIYALLTLLGISVAISELTEEAGISVLIVLALPVMAVVGFLFLVAKVILDHLNSEEDDYYSKNVDK